MEIVPFRILIADALSHAALIIDGPSGEILAEVALPRLLTLTDLTVPVDSRFACLAFSRDEQSGVFAFIDLDNFSLGRFSSDIPYPSQVSVLPGGGTIYLSDASGNLHLFSSGQTLAAKMSKPQGAGRCTGLANDGETLYGVWESAGGGILAAFNPDGQVLAQYSIGGIPTGLTLDQSGRLYVPFAATAFCGEGVYVVSPGAQPTVVSISCSRCSAAGGRVYPLHVAVDCCRQLAYVTCEDNATIAIIDTAKTELCGTIALGRSVSRIALLPDTRFAVASSNMFADLCLIDLVNRRLLAFSTTKRELLSPLAVFT